jgi:ferrous iron transport protein A
MANEPEAPRVISLGELSRGAVATVESLDCPVCEESSDLEERLLDLGFIEGTSLEIVHEGPWGRDPIAVRILDTVIAIRRVDAQAIKVRL